MAYTTSKISGNQIRFDFTVPAEEFETYMQKAYLKERGRIVVPGFRKGKAPRKLIENMYGEGVFYDTAFELL
ncbi:MAG: trigger factor family protein, partial [Eubacteriales bacterium]|nr:trigger factor family protein [Eubacteriales bacterium]